MKKTFALIGLLLAVLTTTFVFAGSASAEDYGLPNAPVAVQQAFGAFSSAFTQAFAGAPAAVQTAVANFLSGFAGLANLLFGIP
ncbi:hypothetical protein GCM10022215_27510 [Nocardioides fonticola]|uniref:Uncharacterized protein n=1 Tax=Nocardioides fonticola TaxID=450363 RepID=A0ABP7XM98_9ACTN